MLVVSIASISDHAAVVRYLDILYQGSWVAPLIRGRIIGALHLGESVDAESVAVAWCVSDQASELELAARASDRVAFDAESLLEDGVAESCFPV